MVDGATLERLCGRKSTGGSNPPPSAKRKVKKPLYHKADRVKGGPPFEILSQIGLV